MVLPAPNKHPRALIINFITNHTVTYHLVSIWQPGPYQRTELIKQRPRHGRYSCNVICYGVMYHAFIIPRRGWYNVSMVTVANGTVHNTPADLRKVLFGDTKMLAAWNSLTPLARNEFNCWITSAAKPQTRARRIMVAKDKLLRGERRPCCWIGCIHRTDKEISPSVKGILQKRGAKP